MTTTNRPRSPSPAEDIAAQQTKIIAELRKQLEQAEEINQQRERRLKYLEQIQREYNELMQAFGNDGRITYNQAMQTILTRHNAEIQRERDMINAQKPGDLEARRQAAHDEEAKEALNSNPHFVNDCNVRKAKIQQDKDKMSSRTILSLIGNTSNTIHKPKT